MSPELQSVLALYLKDMPRGRYHRRDDKPAGVFCDGAMVCVVDGTPDERHAGSLAAALVLLLNERATAHALAAFDVLETP